MLQKLENAYLAILRFIVIAVAGVLLIAVVILGFNSFKAIQSEPEPKEIIPQVSAQELIKGITVFPTVMQQSEHHVDAGEKNITDSNAAFYERSSNAILSFIEKYSDREKNKAGLIEVLKEQAEVFEEPKLVTAYAKGFAESIEETLLDPSVVKEAARAASPWDVIDNAMRFFRENFQEQLKEENEKFAAKQQQHIIEKADGIQSLYIAAGAFAAFIIIVFLSIIIKIERNLRYLENRS